MKARHLLEATGASIIALFPYYYQLFLPLHLRIYHHDLPITTIVRGLLLDMLGVFALGCVVIIVVTRLSPRVRNVIGACLAGLVIWRFLLVAIVLRAAALSFVGRDELEIPTNALPVFWTKTAYFLKFAAPLSLAMVALWKPAISRPFIRGARFGLAGVAFSAMWIIPTLSWVAFEPHSSSVLARGPVSAQPRERSDQRVIWIVFDELSYDLAFDHRPAGLLLPQFEKVHSKSMSLGNLEPVGYFTDRVIPSLLLGQPVDQIRSDLDGNLSYTDQAQHRWVSYDADKTLFGLANANGWNPGVSGWFNPYCRVFASVLSSCFWRSEIGSSLALELMGASSDKSSLENALILPRYFLLSHGPQQKTDDKALTYNRLLQDYHSIMTEASTLIQSDRVHFVFVHLPLPHPPGLYDRKTHRYSKDGNYLDNLVLADEALGDLMQQIDSTPLADRTTVIVSSDHSWRVPIWRTGPDWTKEEEQISQGRFEPRPVFLVHFPGESSGGEVRIPLSELVEHEIIAKILKGEMKTADDLGAFLQSSTQQVAHTD